MAGAPYTLRGIWSAALTGAAIIAFACVGQAAFAPTVRVSCPARTSAASDCDLRWLVAFDMIPIRHKALPALQPVGEIVNTGPRSRRGGAYTLYLNTSAGRVRTSCGETTSHCNESSGIRFAAILVNPTRQRLN